jgi:hypothetical protein
LLGFTWIPWVRNRRDGFHQESEHQQDGDRNLEGVVARCVTRLSALVFGPGE